MLIGCLIIVSLVIASDHGTVRAPGAAGPAFAADDFARADGPLGPDWTDDSDGALAISSGAVVGGLAKKVTGDIWAADTFAASQFSQVQVTSKPMSGRQWVGPAVQMQAGGQDAYVGTYFWNNGRPELELLVRNAGIFSLLGRYISGRLAPGTELKLVATGSTIAFLENGQLRIAVSDSTLSGGAPGIMAFGTAAAGKWSGGNITSHVSYPTKGAEGIRSYRIAFAGNGPGPQAVRVLSPAHPAAGVAHNFLIVLPVEAALGDQFGDGLATLQSLDAQDQYNLTIVEPTFAIDPWYADNPNDPDLQYETFMTRDLVPWIKRNLATTGREQVWLIGFSKSGIGGQDLILKHPNVFTLAASWDAPFGMSSYAQFGSDSAGNYGTQANFQANYQLTQAFVAAHKAPFLAANRIWIGGYGLYQTDDTDYDSLLTSEGIAHSTEAPQYLPHRWESGWVLIALAALSRDSRNLHH